MDPLTIGTGMAALVGAGLTWRMRCRALQAEARLRRLRGELAAEQRAASRDPLTGLPNRRAFFRAGTALLADDARYPLLVVVIDLDYFKQINDAFGHAAGDEVLITVGRRFTCYAGDNLVARLGGDEFAGLLASPTVDSSWLSQVRHCLADVLSAPMTVAGNQLVVTASIGLVPVNCRVHLATALHDADVAMYRAKLSARQARPRFQPLESVIVAESLTRQSARLRHRPSLADRTSGMEVTGS